MKPNFTTYCSLFCLTLLSACNNPEQKAETSLEEHDDIAPPAVVATLDVHNPSDFARPDQSVYLDLNQLGLSIADLKHLSLKVESDGDVLASEIVDLNNDQQSDGLIFMLPLSAADNRTVSITKASNSNELTKKTQAEISIKNNGQWQPHSKYPNSQFKEYVGGEFKNVQQVSPEQHYTDHSNWIRYEGPGIESDKVGYRIYLDHRNGFDIFGKTTAEMALQHVGQDGYASYHEMQDWGMDILKVGGSLGAGGFGLWHEDKLHHVTDVEQRTATITANNALRSAFNINYQNWRNPIGEVNLSADFAMEAGSRLVEVTLNFDQKVKNMAAGIVKHPGTEIITGELDITGKAYSYIASWGPQALDGSMLGIALFFQRSALDKVTEDDKNYLAIMSPHGLPASHEAAAQLQYYYSAVWQKESGIESKQQFTEYLQRTAETLTLPPRMRLKTALSEATTTQYPPLDSPLLWSQKLADSELKRKAFTYRHDGWDVHRQRLPKFEYDIVGLYPYSLYKLALATKDPKYKEALHQIPASFITENGEIKRYTYDNFNIDSVAPGRAVLALYKETGDEKYKKAATLLREQLKNHPKTSEGAFWHKKKYSHQLWLDGVYMGMPFLAEYSLMFEDGHSLDEVVNEFILTEKYLKDDETGLYYHGWDEAKAQSWANQNTGLSPHFWGRGLGWLAMALVDVLELLPQDREHLREPLLRMSRDLANTLVTTQDSTGTWWQIMDQPDATGNYRESSASAMFTYFLAKGVSNGYIDSKYQDAAKKAWRGLIDEFVTVEANGNISMTNQCYVAGLGFGRNGSYQYYMSEPVWQNDPKGNVPFILAGIAINEM